MQEEHNFLYVSHIHAHHNMVRMYVHVSIVYSLVTDTLTTCTQSICPGSVCVCVHLGFLELCHVTYSLLGAALVFASGSKCPRQTLDLTGAMFSCRSPQLIFRAQLLQKSFVFVDFEYSRDWWMLVLYFFCLKMTHVSREININKSNRKPPWCVFKKGEKEKHDIWNMKHNDMLAICHTSEEK